MFREYDLDKTHQLLEPGPVVLVSTARGERSNLMTMGFHMMVRHEPPLIAAVIGPWDHSYDTLRETGECVIAVPTVDLAAVVVRIGNSSGSDIDKFAAFGLTRVPASKVGAPLVAECLANIECRVADQRLVADHNLFLLDAVAVWLDVERTERRTLHHRGDGTFSVDGAVIDLKAEMTKWPEFL